MKNTFCVTLCHFHLYKKNTLVIQGYFPYDNQEGYELKLLLNGSEIPFETVANTSNEIRRRYVDRNQNISTEFLLEVELPSEKEVKLLEVVSQLKGERERSFSLSKRELEALRGKYNFNIDSSIVLEDSIRFVGWTAASVEEEFHLFEGDKEIEVTVKRLFRKDVINIFQELGADSKPGFELEFKRADYKNLKLFIYTPASRVDCGIDTKKVLAGGCPLKDKSFSERLAKAMKENSIGEIIKKGLKKIEKNERVSLYMDTMMKYNPTEAELQEQRETVFKYNPQMSIVVPMYNTPEKYLKELIDSVVNQTYGNWELILADGSPADTLGDYIRKNYPSEDRIKYTKLANNGGISENTNAAMDLASGDFLVLSDHDDTLAINALFECVKMINDNPDCDVLYTDEDKVSMEGDVYFDPSFKPDFNIDYLRSVNYICHLFVFSRGIYEQVGQLNKEYDGAQDHDFILRCVERAKKVCHVPKVLYHWRCHIDSTAMNLESKLYALDNGARAVEAHYKRLGIPATVEKGEFYGTYHTVYHWTEKPKVSIIIPTKDHVEDLKKCIDSIDRVNRYENIELVIVENNSTERETFEYYESLKGRADVKLVTYRGGFNFSAINNLGAENASGDYFLLLNNDTEIINSDCIKEMLDVTMRDDVGICGARLYYPDNTIQHAGIIMGIGGTAGHMFVGLDKSAPGYMYRAATTQDLTAVTAACLMIKRSVFEEVSGLTESLAVAFNDVDLCLKVRAAGYLVVYNPYAQLTHYESKSRGYEDSAEKQTRFNSEVEGLESLWPGLFAKTDPYYNPNLSLVDGLFKIKE